MRDRVIQEARSWLGTPYHHHAAVKGAGVDCAQILIEVYSKAGVVEKFDTGSYPHDWHMHRSEERYLGWVEKYCTRVENPQKGDIALFQFGRCASHAAIIIDWPGELIHSYVMQGVVLVSASDSELRGRFHSFWSPFKEDVA